MQGWSGKHMSRSFCLLICAIYELSFCIRLKRSNFRRSRRLFDVERTKRLLGLFVQLQWLPRDYKCQVMLNWSTLYLKNSCSVWFHWNETSGSCSIFANVSYCSLNLIDCSPNLYICCIFISVDVGWYCN